MGSVVRLFDFVNNQQFTQPKENLKLIVFQVVSIVAFSLLVFKVFQVVFIVVFLSFSFHSFPVVFIVVFSSSFHSFPVLFS
jgi:hypothetical protein